MSTTDIRLARELSSGRRRFTGTLTDSSFAPASTAGQAAATPARSRSMIVTPNAREAMRRSSRESRHCWIFQSRRCDIVGTSWGPSAAAVGASKSDAIRARNAEAEERSWRRARAAVAPQDPA